MLDGTRCGVNSPPFEVQIALPLTERFGYTFATTYPDMTPAKASFESRRLIRTRFAIPLLLASLTVAHQANAAEPRAHKVAAGTLKTTVQWDAVFEAKVMQPVKATPKAWFDMTVIDALDHGSRVEKGDVLVRLDLEKLREQIADQERDQPLSKIALELAQADLRNLTESTPARLDTARRNQKIASEDFDYFVSTARPQREKSAAFSVKSAEDRLEGAREELRQLEKMYKADDLTEESEEIVLKRQRFAVESSEFYLNYTKQNTERELNVTLPRDLDVLKSKKRDEEMLLSFWDATLPQSLEKKRLEVEKLRLDQEKAARRFADLKQDLAELQLRSPLSGIVYYGACDQGRWTTGAMVGKKLVAGGKLMPNEVFMTVVDPTKLMLRASIGEGDLARIKPGTKGEAVPTSAPESKLAAEVESVDIVPQPTGNYLATLSVKIGKGSRLMPGMNCKVTFKDVPRYAAVLVPKAAVNSEGKESRVTIKAGGKEETRVVKVGESDGTMTEILEGLKAGDVVVVSKSK